MTPYKRPERRGIGVVVLNLKKKAFRKIACAHARRLQRLQTAQPSGGKRRRHPAFERNRRQITGEIAVFRDVFYQDVHQPTFVLGQAHPRRLDMQVFLQGFGFRTFVLYTGKIPFYRRCRASFAMTREGGGVISAALPNADASCDDRARPHPSFSGNSP